MVQSVSDPSLNQHLNEHSATDGISLAPKKSQSMNFDLDSFSSDDDFTPYETASHDAPVVKESTRLDKKSKTKKVKADKEKPVRKSNRKIVKTDFCDVETDWMLTT